MKSVFSNFFAEFSKHGYDMVDQNITESTYENYIIFTRGIRNVLVSKTTANNIVKTFSDKYPEYSFKYYITEKGWVEISFSAPKTV